MIPHTKHFFRAAFIIGAGLIGFLVFRGFMLPDSFGEYGFFRGAAVEEQMNHPVEFAPKDACAMCHDDIWKTHQIGKHANVQCQNCHDALSEHVNPETGEFIKKMPIMKDMKLCLRCHLKQPARPTEFPQIDLEDHLAGLDYLHDSTLCFNCHNPHDPTIGKK